MGKRVFGAILHDADKLDVLTYILKSNAASEADGEDPKSAALKKLFLYLQNSRKGMTSLSLPNKVVKKIDELLELLADYSK